MAARVECCAANWWHSNQHALLTFSGEGRKLANRINKLVTSIRPGEADAEIRTVPVGSGPQTRIPP